MYEPTRPIDYDAGLVMRQHPSGIEVFMFKDERGVYRNKFGTPVDEALARECGFNVDRDMRDRRKRERLADAQATIEQELASEDAKSSAVVAERNGFKVQDLGLGRYRIVDPDGNVLTAQAIPREQALSLLEKLA